MTLTSQLGWVWIALLCSALLAACGEQTAQPESATPDTPTAVQFTPSPTVEETEVMVEATIAVTPTVLIVPTTSGPPPPTPTVPAFLLGDFLELNQTEDCQLPCWQGLAVGKSDVEDVQQVFHSAFGFDENVDILTLPFPEYSYSRSARQDEIAVAVVWGLAEPTSPYREIGFRFDKETQTLRTLAFHFMEAPEPGLSPQELISELGTPSYIFVSIQRSSYIYIAIVYMQLIYQNGITAFYGGDAPVEVEYGKLTAELCIQDRFHVPHLTIIEPISDLTRLNVFQQRVIDENIERWGLEDIQTELGISAKEFSDQLLASDDLCFEKDLTP